MFAPNKFEAYCSGGSTNVNCIGVLLVNTLSPLPHLWPLGAWHSARWSPSHAYKHELTTA